ncbi:unnamed protein product, partial [Symbiodinium sp. CCMP2456]
MYGQLMAKAEAVIRLPACFEHKLSFVKPRKADFGQLLMLPHVLFSHVYHNEKPLWNRTFVASSERLEDFWAAVKAVPHPAWVKHPLKLQEEAGKRSTKRCVPLSLHGDEVPVAGLGKVWGRKMVNWSFSSLAGLGSTKSSQFWIWGLFEKVGVPGKTLEEFFKVLRWSLYWLWLGKWPESDVDGMEHMGGRPLADGWFGCLFALIGDLEYLSAVLGLPSHNNSKNCCALCKASLSGINSWSDFRPAAAWRAQVWTYESWQSWANRSKNVLFTLPGVSALSVHLDWMHSKYLGIDQFTFGSCLALLTCTGMVPGSEQSALETCWNFIQDYYREHKTK